MIESSPRPWGVSFFKRCCFLLDPKGRGVTKEEKAGCDNDEDKINSLTSDEMTEE